MVFKETGLRGAYIIEIEQNKDERGFFARAFCQKEFTAHGLEAVIKQSNISYSKNKGTLRGMHYQSAPFEETKLVSCIKGKVYDVIIDLRKNSDTYCKWYSVELSEEDHKMLYVPKGFAHGFQTLKDNSVFFYQMFESYHPEYAMGVRWNDPLFSIEWPSAIRTISLKDKTHPLFKKDIL
ncbi:MAG: dTDP-4-dehydrorhamnose 3,5-epimerase [Candidatus Omnitrophota bacterium]